VSSFVINSYAFGGPNKLWSDLSSTSGKIITGFKVVFSDALTVYWGDGTTSLLTSDVSVNKTLGTTNAIELETNNGVITFIDCGSSSPRLGGSVDISAFPNLQDFRCNSNNITALSGYAQNSNLRVVEFFDNKVTGSIPSLSSLNALREFRCDRNQITGTIPSLDGLSALRNFQCQIQLGTTKLTGPIPSLSGLNELRFFQCHENQLTGTIPSLSGLNLLNTFICHTNQLTGTIPSLGGLNELRAFQCHENQLTGTIPSLSGLNLLISFNCYTNQLTGSIPSLISNTQLIDFQCFTNQLTGPIPSLNAQHINFQCYDNQLTGSIPSLSANTQLINFWCNNNQLTGFAGGSVSITLGSFLAHNNQLTVSAVNAILAAFVAANKTTGTRTLNLGGTGNAAPTGQGLTDKSTLQSRGWTVTTN